MQRHLIQCAILTVLGLVWLPAGSALSSSGNTEKSPGSERSSAPLRDPADIVVRVDPNNQRGQVECALYDKSAPFPSNERRAVQVDEANAVADEKVKCLFEDVTPGTYAVAVLHDEDSDDTVDRNFMGIPTEGWGASGDETGSWSAPQFKDAKFEVNRSKVHITVELNY